MTISGSDLEPVHVAIPGKFVGRIESLLAELEKAEAEGRPVPKPLGPRATPPDLGSEWPIAELQRLIAGKTATHATVIAVLDLLAKHPAGLVSATTISAAAGIPRQRLKGAFATLPRLLKAHHDYDRFGLPLNRQTIRSEKSHEERYYWLTTEQARRWKAARESESTPASGTGAAS